MSRTVREPIQVYLTRRERSDLDRLAREMGVSRSEALRRGVRVLEGSGYAGALRELTEEGLVTPPAAGPGDPPPSRPVTTIQRILSDLHRDRSER